MNLMKIGFFEIKPQEEELLTKGLPNHNLTFSKEALTPENVDQYQDLEVISPHSASEVSFDVLNKLPNLKLIAARTTGFDNIDIKAANQKNILVCNVPAYGENTVAEYTFALMLALQRRIVEAVNRTRQTMQLSVESLTGYDLKNKIIGVIGTGHIGAHVIQIAKGFEMKVVAFDAFPNLELSQKFMFNYAPLEQILPYCDILTLHVPYLPSTHHLINTGNYQKIKRGAILINTARGAVVETKALVAALEEKILSGAALDVLEEENELKPHLKSPNPTEEVKQITQLNLKLINMENCLVTPHNAFDTYEALQRILETTVSNIANFQWGTPQNEVHPPKENS